ncbi:MAG TPA: hypothetical protein VMY88_00930 [Acidimicrobiales bacterium]|nr:hypothetical protein [Acidimicrobiales bacterium]
MSRGRRSRAVVLIALLGLVAAACGEQAEPTVRLQNVQADIVFGEITPPPPPAPANFSGGPVGQIEDVVEVDEIEFDDKGFLTRLPPRAAPIEPCPPAALTEFPDKEASLNVEGKPAVGLYRWVRSGEQMLAAAPTFKIPVSGFEKRLIRAVEAENDTTFTFETVQSEMGTGQIVVTRYRVKTAPTQQRVGPTDVRVGEPDRGVAIYQIERFDPKTGASISTFTPTPPVLILPLPIVPGEAFDATGIDPGSGSSLRISGSVRKRQQVDACGEVIDGWLVEGTRTTSGLSPEDSATQTYHYIVATQLGGAIIQEYLESSNTTGSAKITFRVGQTVPDPLPADAAS